MKYIITVDPGVTTGFGRAVLDQGQFTDVWFDQDTDEGRFLGIVWDELRENGQDTVIVCEAYIITAETLRKTRQTASLELIGALRWMAGFHGAHFELQQPAQAKKLATDARLKAIGWWNKTTRDHANDAARHLFLWGCRYRYINPLEVDRAGS